MATFFLDHVGGNDANAGTSFALRWKTFATGATAARTAPGDIIRIMASTNETSLGVTGVWTQDSRTITLASAVTVNISDCETAWTASANVTSTADTSTYKENTKSAKHSIAAAFTTGLAAFFATGTLNLSAYQQVSFWILPNAAIPISTLSLRLCSDAAGVTTVNTIAIPALPNSFGQWICITVDTGGALGGTIASVALYCDIDPGTVTIQLDNIIACKALSSADSLSLKSLLGKVWNVSWVASTSYATNDIRKPTQPNRNGYRYKVTGGGGGAAGATEPTWPQEIGKTVTDGALTWTCEGIEDTWYGIQSINGTVVKLDTGTSTLGNAGRGYSGATETVTTYKREPISSMGVNGGVANAQQEAGAAGSRYTYTGGWNTTDMSTQTGETWLDLQCGLGTVFSPLTFTTFFNLNAVRGNIGIANAVGYMQILNCHMNNHITTGIDCSNTGVVGSGQGLAGCNNTGTGFKYGATGANFPIRGLRCSGNGGYGVLFVGTNNIVPHVDWLLSNNAVYGAFSSANYGAPFRCRGLLTRGNAIGGFFPVGDAFLTNSLLSDTTPIVILGGTDAAVYSQRDGQVADAHLITWEGGTITSATDQRHTASGISWKFRPTTAIRNSERPLRLSVAKVACAANALVTVTIWCRRDNTNILGQLLVLGGQILGVGADVSTACAPTINTWTQYTLTFTPTEAGVVEVHFLVWDGTGSANNFWIDDFGVTQA